MRILPGNGQDGSADFHAAQAVFDRFGDVWLPTPKEHFGFTDGIGDPIFAGQLPEKDEKEAVIGRGKRMGKGWEPLNPGEFILGHPDESQELPPTAKPPEFMRNGSFMAYRKLHENVGSFREVIATEADRYARVQGILPDEAQVTLRARMVGRWPDGIPLAHAPTFSDWQKARAETGMDDQLLRLWSDDHNVSRGALAKSKGIGLNLIPVVDAGAPASRGLAYTPLAEIVRGDGSYVICQLRVVELADRVPGARFRYNATISFPRSRKATSIGNMTPYMWTALLGISSNPSPFSRDSLPIKPRRRGHHQFAILIREPSLVGHVIPH